MPEILSTPDFAAIPARNVVESLNNTFDFHLIFSDHGPEEFVQDLAAEIPDNSIAFSEGYLKTEAYAAARLSQHHVVANQRIVEGQYSAAGTPALSSLVSEFTERRLQPNLPPDAFSKELYTRILGKNCLLLLADYVKLPFSSDVMGDVSHWSRIATATRQLTPQNLAVTAEAVTQSFEKLAAENTVREHFAFVALVGYLRQLLQSGANLSTFSRTPDDKIRISLIYGLAHRNSLMKKFEREGLSARRTVLLPHPNIKADQLLDLDTVRSLSHAELLEDVTRDLSSIL